ncbi:uncharacterized protein TRAVEDRAFT_114217 [Trametes versicolor FP-101664 SS1]|uniref:uncharacterized protein n=1 Tax=Trametes versicolor (strain FP-101664) TaxID=717944 RepID=UPI00046245D8|nr:uncharacterized protein TRAVEDRAFT_114217 [Trametes versicolor FP-101664 SS1]EIW63200.1 hypothetical protein TRAVEDRAFT_114217 [Trametes versicolor FP-101664 SS1]
MLGARSLKSTSHTSRTSLWSGTSQVQACRIRLASSPRDCRAASTSANPYPFPKATHPTPHQIFHLPRSATRADVKARYYDLVRIYHPDSPVASAGGISPEIAHARFQAIASAYAVLSGKKPASSLDGSNAGEGPMAASRATYHDLSTAMWRARQAKRAELDVGLDDRWKERMMLGVILLVRLRDPL